MSGWEIICLDARLRLLLCGLLWQLQIEELDHLVVVQLEVGVSEALEDQHSFWKLLENFLDIVLVHLRLLDLNE